MLYILYQVGKWFDLNYEKIWLITAIVATVLFVIGLLFRNDTIYGMSEDVSDFYDEVLSE